MSSRTQFEHLGLPSLHYVYHVSLSDLREYFAPQDEVVKAAKSCSYIEEDTQGLRLAERRGARRIYL
jgi:hypothetical protein